MKEPFAAKASPKTLKQLYKEEEFNPNGHLRTFAQDHINATIEWLTQKRQILHPDPKNYIFKPDVLTIQAFIDVLLEELNHE